MRDDPNKKNGDELLDEHITSIKQILGKSGVREWERKEREGREGVGRKGRGEQGRKKT